MSLQIKSLRMKKMTSCIQPSLTPPKIPTEMSKAVYK